MTITNAITKAEQFIWLNDKCLDKQSIMTRRELFYQNCPHHIMLDDFLNTNVLLKITKALASSHLWKQQRHLYGQHYVNEEEWQDSKKLQFVQRNEWVEPGEQLPAESGDVILRRLLDFLRGESFFEFLKDLTGLPLCLSAHRKDNTKLFSCGSQDFIGEHKDNSLNRELCLLLYLSPNWSQDDGGHLCFRGRGSDPINYPPLFNRCVLFAPASAGASHWITSVRGGAGQPHCVDVSGNNSEIRQQKMRYNVTSWYYSK